MMEPNVLSELYTVIQGLTGQLASVMNIVQNLQTQVNDLNSQLTTSLMSAIHTSLSMNENESLHEDMINVSQNTLTNSTNSANSENLIIIIIFSLKFKSDSSNQSSVMK